MNNSNGKHSSSLLSFLILLCILGPFIIISFFNFPTGDDFWYGHLVRRDGYWKAQWEFYSLISPRYTTFAITCLFPLSFGRFYGYKLIPLVAMVLIVLTLAHWFRRTGGEDRKGAFWLALLFTGVYFAVQQGIGEGLYWASAVAGYDTAIVLFVLWLTELFGWYSGGQRGSWVVVTLCLNLVVLGGCNELMMPVCGIILLALILYRRLVLGKIDWLLSGMLVIVAGCFLVAALSKGVNNRYRLNQGLHSVGTGYSAGFSVVVVGYCILRVLINPFFWAALLAGYPVFNRWSGKFYQRQRDLFGRDALLYTGAALGVILFMMPFSILYLLGLHPFHRVNNLVAFFLLLGLLYYGTFFLHGRRSARVRWPLPALKGRWAVAILLLLAAGFILPNNVSEAAGEIVSGKAYHYDREQRERWRLISGCQGDSCVVPPLRHIAVVLRYDSTDSDDPSVYFGKNVLIR